MTRPINNSYPLPIKSIHLPPLISLKALPFLVVLCNVCQVVNPPPKKEKTTHHWKKHKTEIKRTIKGKDQTFLVWRKMFISDLPCIPQGFSITTIVFLHIV